MIADPTLEAAARELLCEAWSRGTQTIEKKSQAARDCPILWMVPEILDLVAEHHERPVHELTPVIRRLLIDRNILNDTADFLTRKDDLDAKVDTVVNVFEEVRQVALDQGQWSNAPVTPLMCG